MLEGKKIKVPQDVFDLAKEKMLSNKYSNKNFRCQFDITGKNGGKWYILLNNKNREVKKGVIKNPKGTLIMDETDFIKLVNGKLNIPSAFLFGKIKIKGDRNHIVKLAETLLS